MKKLVLLSMAALLTLGVSARINSAYKAVQKAPVVQNAPMAVDQRTIPLKATVAMPQIALDSKSKAGETLSLKADGSASTSAYYSRSLGGFFTGLSLDFYGYQGWNFITFYPAFTEVKHTAYIPEDVTPSWTYYESTDENAGIDGGNEAVLTQNLKNDLFYAPELTANDSTFSWGYLQAGGSGSLTYNGKTFFATNSDRSWFPNGSYVNPDQTTVNSTDVGTIYSDVDEGVSILEGVAEFVSVDPNHPYVLNAVYPVVSCPETGGTVTMTIYKALQNEQGIYAGWTDQVVVTADVEIEPSENAQILSFEDLLTADPETGLDVPIVVDYPILVVLSSSDGAQFYPTWLNHAENIPTERHAFIYWQDMDADTGEYEPVVTSANWSYNFSDDPNTQIIRYATAWQWQYDIDYNYLVADDNTFDAPVEGGSKEFNITANWNSKAWTIETADGDDLPEWLTYEAEDGTEEGSDGKTYYSGESVLTLTAAALEEGAEPRELDVVIYFDGAKQTIHVTQGEETPQPEIGDVNGDNTVNTGDISDLYSIILGAADDNGNCDINGDNSINTGDISSLYNIILGVTEEN